MKSTLISLFVFCTITLSAQVSTRFFENKNAFDTFQELGQVVSKNMPKKEILGNNMKLFKEYDNKDEQGKLFYFGNGIDVNYTLDDGKWEEIGDKRIWSMRIHSLNAFSLNFVFHDFILSPDAELYVYNVEGTMVYGPVTSAQNAVNGTFLTDLIKGDDIIIQLLEPKYSKEISSFKLSKVVHGYINMFKQESELLERAASDCYIPVTNDPNWESESNGVVLLLTSGGTAFGSGALMNNTSQDGMPYILTAFHCLDVEGVPDKQLSNTEKNAVGSWLFRFQYKSSSSSYVTYNGAYFNAAWYNSDFALLELKNSITQPDITFLGWSRYSANPSSGTGIHHAEGLPMKISYDDNTILLGNCIPNNSQPFWKLSFDRGGAAQGASGSPLFDSNKLVIGQLRGPVVTSTYGCPPDLGVFYGPFHISWTGGGTKTTRLSDWLSPGSSGPMTLSSRKNIKITGPNIIPCTETVTYTTNHPLPVTWSVFSSIQIVSGQGTNTISVRKSPSGQSNGGLISVNSIYMKSVFVGAPQVTSVSGSSSASVGSGVYFYAAPMFPEGDYEWSVSPSTATQSVWRHTNFITFNAPGEYVVGCRSTSNCTTPGSYMTTYIFVSGYNYNVASGGNKRLIVTIDSEIATDATIQTATKTSAINYELINQRLGSVVAKGQMPIEGGMLDFSGLSSDIYLFRIHLGNNRFETHRIMLD